MGVKAASVHMELSTTDEYVSMPLAKRCVSSCKRCEAPSMGVLLGSHLLMYDCMSAIRHCSDQVERIQRAAGWIIMAGAMMRRKETS